MGFSVGTSTTSDSYRVNDGENRFEVSTSHGVLINPYIFVGGGVGFHFYTGYYDDNEYYSADDLYVGIPIFVHVRSHFIDSRVTPFADVKLGYSVYDNLNWDAGLYFAPSFGCRFATGSRSGFWLSIGYSLQQFEGYRNDINANAFTFKIGWDF